jgi:release factor glutamine methyltransferase
MTISEARISLIKKLTEPFGEGEARSIARLVFEDFYNYKSPNDSDDSIFENLIASDFELITQRLLKGEPVQYILGFAWFYGQKFKINPQVLIPRPETEELVEFMLETLEPREKPFTILDIGTGSGCIPVTLKLKRPHWQVSAVDISESALITASRNAFRHQADVNFTRLDILEAHNIPDWGSFDVIVSNPPYIPNAEKALMSSNVLDFEPPLALFVSDEEPLIFYEKIANFALKNLNPNGKLFFECNEFYAQKVVEYLENSFFENILLRHDMSGKPRIIVATKPS